MGEGAVIKHARRLLEDRGHRPDRILWVEPESIGFVEPCRASVPGGPVPEGMRGRTAWLRTSGERLIVAVEDGFPLTPGRAASSVLGDQVKEAA